MENQAIPDSEKDQIFEDLRKIPENDKCFDCGKKNPKWTSVYLGLMLCIDCSGKHREYGIQISFVRSITLDSWSRRQILFIQYGGNARAREYFERFGLINASSKTVDYKNPIIQKYKAEQTRKVDSDTLLSSNSRPVAYFKIYFYLLQEVPSPKKEAQPAFQPQLILGSNVNPVKEVESPQKQPAVIISLPKKDFKKEPAQPQNTEKFKTLQGKKINNIDFDQLMFDDPFSSQQEVKRDLMDNTQKDPVVIQKPEVLTKEVSVPTNLPPPTQSTQEQLDKMREKNVKAISSQALFSTENSEQDRQNVYKFSGQTAISSKQFFGEPEEPDTPDNNERAEKVQQFFSNVGGKAYDAFGNIAEKTGGVWEQLRQKFGKS